MGNFKLVSPYKPCGDQPQAIKLLTDGIARGLKEQVLLGVTGSGKTFTIANVIERCSRPVLVISHNKTLAAQLYSELKEFFPENAVEYFVSYYDYYQPEAYVPHTDTYIEKDASINEDLDRLRLSATSSLLSRRDTIIVASVSCIYGLGSPEDWQGLIVKITRGGTLERDDLLRDLVKIQYERRDEAFGRGSLRVRGDTVDIFPSYALEPIRIEFATDKVARISRLDAKTHRPIAELDGAAIYPAKHFVTPSDKFEAALKSIEAELKERIKEFEKAGKPLEAKRIESRTRYDLEMLREVGYCSGIENYSRHLSGRAPGSRPYTLIDYFPEGFLTVIDESHVTIPQLRGMYEGDRARKETLVKYGFRLPSALDNRPLRFDEFDGVTKERIYVSATPSEFERSRSKQIVEQVIRPTGIVDPAIEIRPTKGQIDDLIKEINSRAKKKERVLVTTLTKRMAEDLSRYLKEAGLKVHYLHSEFDAFERVEILKDLRLEKYDCVIGVNLLREGLDLPEVSLVVILDADKEGFLRSEVSLIQTSGRAARHINGKVIMYGDTVTRSMKACIEETARRRKKQLDFNKENKIKPQSIKKAIREGIEKMKEAEKVVLDAAGETKSEHEMRSYLSYLEERMERAAHALDFERAARFRDEINRLKKEIKQ
ncbi:MAG: excinuclease ABC subunit UvrB [Candidatus Omnitrophica bacterium]|nr:excinuclease ABC subunit UvrB [Candidatus Omnitrophota bacterium]